MFYFIVYTLLKMAIWKYFIGLLFTESSGLIWKSFQSCSAQVVQTYVEIEICSEWSLNNNNPYLFLNPSGIEFCMLSIFISSISRFGLLYFRDWKEMYTTILTKQSYLIKHFKCGFVHLTNITSPKPLPHESARAIDRNRSSLALYCINGPSSKH